MDLVIWKNKKVCRVSHLHNYFIMASSTRKHNFIAINIKVKVFFIDYYEYPTYLTPEVIFDTVKRIDKLNFDKLNIGHCTVLHTEKKLHS